MTRITDLANRRFGKLLVVQRVSRPEEIKQGTYWLCKCDCGNKKIIWSWSLISGITNSCGCLRKKNIGLYQSAINRLFRSYKRVAEKRGLYFNISRDYFIKLTSSNCYYCRCIPSQICKSENDTGDYIYNGIDRINNKIGYEENNCVPCCGQCNRSKTNYTIEEFYDWIDRVVENKGKIK